MKPITYTLAAVLFALGASLQAQDASKDVQVDIKSVKIDVENTPQYSVPNVPDKRWRPKTWLELDVTFDAKKARVPGDRSPVIDSLEFRYYVGLNKADASGKQIVLTATITYKDIIEKEAQHAMVFASPAALASILEKPSFTTADVKAVGIEVLKGGALAGGYSSGGGKWWEKADLFSTVAGTLLPKSKTAFAPLWGDYDLEVSQ